MEYQKIKIPKEKLLPEAGIVKSPEPNSEQESMITGGWRVSRPIIDEETCTHCMMCWISCPDACAQAGEDKIEINLKYCKGCGICGDVCPVDAIEMVPELDFEDGVVYQEGLF